MSKRVRYLEMPRPENSYYNLDDINKVDRELVFVFGSNRSGIHGKGAALYARIHKGAIYEY